jgi:hypothetical protein
MPVEIRITGFDDGPGHGLAAVTAHGFIAPVYVDRQVQRRRYGQSAVKAGLHGGLAGFVLSGGFAGHGGGFCSVGFQGVCWFVRLTPYQNRRTRDIGVDRICLNSAAVCNRACKALLRQLRYL